MGQAPYQTPVPSYLRSVVKLQSELDNAWVLRAVCDSHICAQCGASSVEIHPVEGIEEVGTELEFHSLRESEVLLKAQINVEVAWPTHGTLRWAVAEGSGGGRRIRSRVKPLVTNVLASAIEGRLPS